VAGLSLRVGGFGGVGSTDSPQYGTQPSYDSVTAQAFGPGATLPSQSLTSALHPTKPVGAAFWSGVAAVGLLFLIRRSLPN
jgi:hypothetical protein